jgi:hypothetical protein
MRYALIITISVVGMVAFFALVKFMTYGVSSDFGWGFLAGGILFLFIGLGASHLEMKDRERKLIERLSSGSVRDL